jgi:hypothetical protein
MNNANALEDDQQNLLAWKWDDARTAALTASALSELVADFVLTCSDANDAWEKLVSVYEQS